MSDGSGFVAGSIVAKLLLDISGWTQNIQKVTDEQAELAKAFKEGTAPAGAFADLLNKYGLQTAPQTAASVGILKGEQSKLDAAYKSGLINLGAYQKGSADISKQLQELQGITQTTTTTSSGLSKAINGMAGQFAIGMLAVSAFHKGMSALKAIVVDSIKGAIEEEQAEKRLKAALEITGRTVAGNLQHYLKFAEAQMAVTTYTHEEVQASQALLLQLTNLNQDGIDRATKGAMGLASTMGIDLHSATMMVTKAMEGNYGALARVGIKVDENLTKEQKQTALLDQLGKLYGRATAETETFGGSLKQLSNNWDEIKETAGTAIIQMEGLGTAIVALNKAISDFVTSGAFKNWLDQLMHASPVLRNFTDGLKLITLALELESAKAEHATKINEGLGAAVGIIGKTFSGAAPMIKIFGIDFGAVIDLFKIAPKPINETGTAIEETTKKTKSLAEQLGITFRSETEERIKKLNEALLLYRGKMTAEEIQRIYTEINTLTESLTRLKGPVFDLDAAIKGMLDGLDDTAEEVASAISTLFDDGFEEIKRAGEQVIENDLPSYLKDLPPVAKTAAKEVESIWVQCSHVIEDSMKEIASTIVGAFNIKGLFGAVAISVKFDSSGFDAMVKAAESAYDKITDAANRAFDLQELRISRTQEAEDRQRSWTEKFEDRAIARGYEREDRKFQHQYEHERAAIEHSKMTEAQKNAALDKLERKYEHEKDVREMQRQHAADVRERARENAAVARERAREDAKYKREQIQAAKLLALQWKHENDLNAIRIAEDAARQKQATDEETRQKSLWFKVKGIFATAIEQMLTIWITNLITPILTSIISKILPGIKGIGDGAKETLGPKGLGKTVSDAATSIGSIFTTLATTIATVLTTLATGIGTAIVTLATSIGTAVVALATAIASAAEIIAASAPAFIVVGLIAVGIYATIAALKRLFASSSTGAGDGMGRVVERQDVQISLMTILKDLTIDNRTALTSIKTTLWAISTKLDKGVKDKLVTIGGYLKTIASTHYLVTVVSYLKKIADTIGKLTGAAVTGTTHLTTTGAYSGQNVFVGSSQLAHVAIPQALTSSRNQGSSVNINLHVRALDGADVENVVRRRVVPILQNVFNHNGLRVPTGAVGGA